jgi:small subunit ribosomal protein S20
MANHKSAMKRHRQNVKLRSANRTKRAATRSAVKKVVSALEAGKLDEAKMLLRNAESSLASAAKKGLVHRRTARRSISRLAVMVSKSAAK